MPAPNRVSLSQGTYLGNAIKFFSTSSTTLYPDQVTNLSTQPKLKSSFPICDRDQALECGKQSPILDCLGTTLEEASKIHGQHVTMFWLLSILAHSELKSECLIEGEVLNGWIHILGYFTQALKKARISWLRVLLHH
jgi:hypothetical protein